MTLSILEQNVNAFRPQSMTGTTREPFSTLYDRWFGPVYNYARYRLGDPDTADDLTADVFLRAYESYATYRPERGSFSAWLFAIARNRINNHLRDQIRNQPLPLDEEIYDPPEPDPQPEEAMMRRETREELLAALQKLPASARDLVALKFAAKMTNREIAELTGLTESNVGVSLFRILGRLQKEIRAGEVAHGR